MLVVRPALGPVLYPIHSVHHFSRIAGEVMCPLAQAGKACFGRDTRRCTCERVIVADVADGNLSLC